MNKIPDIYETQVKVSFKVPQGEVSRIKNLVNAALSGSMLGRGGGIGNLLGGIGGKIGALGAAAGAAGAIVMSSPSLQITLKHLIKTVMLLIRPIGDIIAVGLRPIIDILRPVGLFFRILIRPYIKKAMEAMRLGRGFLARGQYGKAAEAYALGAAFLLKPFFDQMVTVSTIAVQGILWGIKMLGEGLLAVLDPLDFVRTDFSDTMDSMIQTVGIGGATIIRDTTLMLEEWLVTLKLHYKEIENTVKISMGITSGFVGEGFIRIIQAATNFFVPTLEATTNVMFDNIVNYGIKKVEELNRILDESMREAELLHRYRLVAPQTLESQYGRVKVSPGVMRRLEEAGLVIHGNINISGDYSIDELIDAIKKETGWNIKRG